MILLIFIFGRKTIFNTQFLHNLSPLETPLPDNVYRKFNIFKLTWRNNAKCLIQIWILKVLHYNVYCTGDSRIARFYLFSVTIFDTRAYTYNDNSIINAKGGTQYNDESEITAICSDEKENGADGTLKCRGVGSPLPAFKRA